MKLFHSPASCSLSPAIALFEAGLPVELVKVAYDRMKDCPAQPSTLMR